MKRTTRTIAQLITEAAQVVTGTELVTFIDGISMAEAKLLDNNGIPEDQLFPNLKG